MRTTTVEVGELVSTLSTRGAERQRAALPGVRHVDVSYVAGSATVHYDETQSSLESLRKRVIDCGYPLLLPDDRCIAEIPGLLE